MAIDIFVKDTEKNRKIQFPSLPEKITYSSATKYATYSILGLGDISLPNGRELCSISWENILFGEQFKNYPFIRKWMSPTAFVDILTEWRDKETVLKLIVTDTFINLDVTIASFEAVPTGGLGNYTYSISFLEYREPTIKVGKNTSLAKTTKRSTNNSKVKAKTYTVKSGDCLWKIAQKYYGAGSKYTTIYNANKSTIEATAKKHGYSSSQNGHWIFPGTVLTIP